MKYKNIVNRVRIDLIHKKIIIIFLGIFSVFLAVFIFIHRKEEAGKFIGNHFNEKFFIIESSEKKTSSKFSHPWVNQPSTSTFLSTCIPILINLPNDLSGWSLEDASCLASGWHATYKKLVPGTSEEFQNVVLDRFSIIPVWYEGRGRATIYKPITMPISGDDNLLSARDGKASFLSVMEKFNIQITMNEENSSTIEHRYASSKGIAAFKVI